MVPVLPMPDAYLCARWRRCQ